MTSLLPFTLRIRPISFQASDEVRPVERIRRNNEPYPFQNVARDGLAPFVNPFVKYISAHKHLKHIAVENRLEAAEELSFVTLYRHMPVSNAQDTAARSTTSSGPNGKQIRPVSVRTRELNKSQPRFVSPG